MPSVRRLVRRLSLYLIGIGQIVHRHRHALDDGRRGPPIFGDLHGEGQKRLFAITDHEMLDEPVGERPSEERIAPRDVRPADNDRNGRKQALEKGSRRTICDEFHT